MSGLVVTACDYHRRSETICTLTQCILGTNQLNPADELKPVNKVSIPQSARQPRAERDNRASLQPMSLAGALRVFPVAWLHEAPEIVVSATHQSTSVTTRRDTDRSTLQLTSAAASIQPL